MNGVARQIMLHGQKNTILALEMFLVILNSNLYLIIH
jgi:hypothetical protein